MWFAAVRAADGARRAPLLVVFGMVGLLALASAYLAAITQSRGGLGGASVVSRSINTSFGTITIQEGEHLSGLTFPVVTTALAE